MPNRNGPEAGTMSRRKLLSLLSGAGVAAVAGAGMAQSLPFAASASTVTESVYGENGAAGTAGIFSVADFGAEGDGLADDAAAIQAAFDFARDAGGGVVYFPPGRYMIKGLQTLTFYGNMKLAGVPGVSVLDFSDRDGSTVDAGYKYLISAFGTFDSPVYLTADAPENGSVAQLSSTAGFAEGDLLIVTSDHEWTEVSSYGQRQGEYVIVDEILGQTKLRFKNALHETYRLADQARLHKIHPVSNITIDGLVFVGQGRIGAQGADGGDLGLGITYGRNVEVRNCQFIDIDEVQLEFRSCYRFRADGNYHVHSKYFSASGGIGEDKPHTLPARGTVQYQIRTADCCQYGTIANCVGEGGRHMFNTGHSFRYNDGTPARTDKLFGINRHIQVVGCWSKNTWHAGFSSHQDADFLEFIHCTSENSGMAGFNPRVRNVRVVGCTVVNSARHTYLSDKPFNIEIVDCKAFNCASIIYLDDSLDFDFKNITIKGFIAENSSQGIVIDGRLASSITGELVIADNDIRSSPNTGNYSPIRILGKFRCIVSNNRITDTSIGYAIRLEGVKEAIVTGNAVKRSYRLVYADSASEKVIVAHNTFTANQYAAIDNNAVSPVTQYNVIV